MPKCPTPRIRLEDAQWVLCACGCGEVIFNWRPKNRLVRFVWGHSARLPRFNRRLAIRNRSGSHTMARKWGKKNKCQLEHVGYCKGPLEVAHLDGNYLNNDLSNLATLCTSHHRLVDYKHLTLESTAMPFFMVSSGKRRYKYDRTMPSLPTGDTDNERR